MSSKCKLIVSNSGKCLQKVKSNAKANAGKMPSKCQANESKCDLRSNAWDKILIVITPSKKTKEICISTTPIKSKMCTLQLSS